MRAITVFCGSRPGARPSYLEAAEALGRELAARGVALVYGGAGVGLMARIADAALAAGGTAIGVIPRALVDRELAHPGLTELHVVETLHQRKALMAELSSGFIAMPGGVGTLDELFEIITWRVLDLHAKPIGLLDTDSYWAPLVGLLDHMVAERFLDAPSRDFVLRAATPAALLDLFR
ncbi:MAG TPA: TIGR00730 family Rossman fold protein [Kofleriaceae bacterium]|nr:TIGR00730 family Rossman fold protein [Kofleriaceae bacterium]